MNPSVSFFMVNVASGIARGRVLSPTTAAVEVSHQYGDLSHASLVNIRSHKGSHQLTGIGYSCQLTAVKKTKTRWPVSHDHIAGSDVVSEEVIRRRSRARWSTWVNLCMQLTSMQFDIRDPFHGKLTAVSMYPLTSIAWPYHGLKGKTHRGHVFFKVYRWPGNGFSLDRRLKYFHKILKQAKKSKLRF